MDDVDEAPALVPGAHRVIRRLDSSAAFTGDLVSDGDRQRVRVGAGGLDETLWRFSGAEHVAGVRDVVRTRDGHAVLLPWCADSVDAVLARRTAAGRALIAGEMVTLVGSVLRGVVEVAAHDLCGRWWLDDEARPLFVPGEGATCAGAAVEIIERLRRDCSDRALERLLKRVAEVASDHRVVRHSLDEWERELSELAAPRPIDVAVYAPELVRELPAHRARLPQDVERMQQGRPLRDRIDGARARMAERLNAVRSRVGLPRPGARPRGEAATDVRSPRRRMLLVGAAVAGVVLVGGLMWPTGGQDSPGVDAVAVEAEPAHADSDPSPAAVSAPASADAAKPGEGQAEKPAGGGDNAPGERAGSADDAPSVDGSIEEAVAGLLVVIDSCRPDDDPDCAGAVVSGTGADVRERLGSDNAARDVSLIEDYGDIAVVRLGGSEERREQMIVIVRQDDEWLVRDVYDVADQPSEKG